MIRRLSAFLSFTFNHSFLILQANQVMSDHHDNFADQVYAIIAAIPKGKVATYGQIARLAGTPTFVRQVCFVLRNLPADSMLPCYRIVNSQGKISLKNAGYDHQKQRLLAEGVVFNEKEKIDLKKFGWNHS